MSYLIRHPHGFNSGYTSITQLNDPTNMHFGILKLNAGETFVAESELESAYLLLHGTCQFTISYQTVTAKRTSCFNDAPWVLHLASKEAATIFAENVCEIAVIQTVNPQSFQSLIYHADNMLENEHRGKGILADTAYRIVRTIFDTRNSPHSQLVLGEVITFPGRWSSYPPHHHLHPEIYHYRFTEPQGYGHAECGDDIFKVQQYDTYKILDAKDHAQVAAPGYGMYYLWVIKHLENQPYIAPEFTKAHHWTRSSQANQRVWEFEE